MIKEANQNAECGLIVKHVNRISSKIQRFWCQLIVKQNRNCTIYYKAEDILNGRLE